MESRYREADARAAIDRYGADHGEDVALRVYTSRLIGGDPDLVLHGGGNTSVKSTATTVHGDSVEALYVKGSGSSLDQVEPAGLPAVQLAGLRRLRELDALTDEEMVNQLRIHLFDAGAPNPSVEALLHAFLPHKFVDHSHADAVLALTNQPKGAEWAAECLGQRVAILPYIMPGFPLAKAVAEAVEARPDVEGVVLAKHGLFSFGATARESYERHIELVDACERFLAERERAPRLTPRVRHDAAPEALAARVAPRLRGLLAEATGVPDAPYRRFVMEWRGSPEILDFCNSAEALELAETGPLTPDHVIRTKATPLFLAEPKWDDDEALCAQLEAAVGQYRSDYVAYFERCQREKGVQRQPLDAAPRVALLPGAGALCFGRTARDARIAADITEHTLAAKARAHATGGYEALTPSELFDMEYWSLEQAKLGKRADRALEGQVVFVTGGAGAIGVGIGDVCAAAGAHVVLADVDLDRAQAAASRIESEAGGGSAFAVAADVTDEDSVRAAVDAVCLRYGGIDVAVANAGVAHVDPVETLSGSDARRVADVNYLGVLHTIREAARVFRRQGTGGHVIVNASKNVFAPGKDFGAYSASKAAAHQLGKVAAIELAPLGVRVNLVNADAIFSEGEVPSGLWQEIAPGRARSRGLSEEELPEFYRRRNLLRATVTARHVGNAVVFFASNQTPTTGATLPIDGGIVEAFPR
ncbi:MAG: bifunctional aldolase/short-chain dehydrogenase [Proteobacteria bacterium]|nr:bifunctional aldolase/short-chain dehydrogenase [Pseudomonadota bacterium]